MDPLAGGWRILITGVGSKAELNNDTVEELKKRQTTDKNVKSTSSATAEAAATRFRRPETICEEVCCCIGAAMLVAVECW